MYCIGAPATHYFPVSIPYHGCALNITVQSYLDQLDFGLVACRKTVPDAQRIADFIVEDFAAMRDADANLSRPQALAVNRWAAKPASVSTRKPINLAEAEAETRASKAKRGSALTRSIDALSATTEALLRHLDSERAHAAAAANQAHTPKPGVKKRMRSAAKRSVRKASGAPALAAPPSEESKRRASTKRNALKGRVHERVPADRAGPSTSEPRL